MAVTVQVLDPPPRGAANRLPPLRLIFFLSSVTVTVPPQVVVGAPVNTSPPDSVSVKDRPVCAIPASGLVSVKVSVTLSPSFIEAALNALVKKGNGSMMA
ncbi:hypothetical protein DA101_012760 [Sinorhizobium meliloti]|nr:hypothetical protein DA101_012760 [Sinorhizobium meliloti]